MNADQAAPPAPRQGDMPDHPFRASPWYDPTLEHQPCACPECEAKRQRQTRPWKLTAKTALVVCGGVLLPIASVVTNHALGMDGEHVVQLGVAGTVAIAVSILTTLAHLIWSPVRRDLQTGRPVYCPPQRTWARAALFIAALLGCLTWGYLALLFLPLMPISFIAIIFMGLGLCGLCPYGALAIHVIQVVRGYRGLRARLPRRPVVALMLCCLLLPPAALASAGIHNHLARQSLNRRIDAVGKLAPNSVARMQAFAGLRGLEGHIVDRYLLSDTLEEQALLAEAHLRLTDEPIHGAVRARYSRGKRALIRPWWFLDGDDPLQGRGFWRF